MEKEYKSFDFEIKNSESDDEYFYFEGFASTYGVIDRDDDRIMAGTFRESLSEMSPVVKWLHKEPIGISVSNEERPNGLYVKAKTPLNDTFVKGRVKPQVQIGSVRKLSIGFSATEYNYEKVEGRRWEVRNITKGILYEYSLVDIPANPEASVTDFKSHGNNITLFKHLVNKSLSEADISQKDQDKIIQIANRHISSLGKEKVFTFEDVKDISGRQNFNHFLKVTGLFTKSAREHIAKFLPKRSNSDNAETEVVTNYSNNLKELKSCLNEAQ